jgi:subtilisin family serine protease
MKIKILVFLIVPLVLGTSSYNNKQVKIAIIDTGLDLNDPRFKDHLCESGHKDFTGTGIKDVNGHGSHVTGLIHQYAENANYCMLIYKYYSETASGIQNMNNEIASIDEAIKNGAKIINFSSGGPTFSEQEYDLIDQNPDIVFVVAAGNESKDLDIRGNEYYPASYWLPNELVVGNIDNYGHKANSSNWSKKAVWEKGVNVISTIPCKLNDTYCKGYMTGSSQATAIFSGKLLANKQNVGYGQ